MSQVVPADGAQERVDQAPVVAVDERPEHGDDDHRQHHRNEEGDAVPAGPPALDRHEAREGEPDGHLEDQGGGDVDERVDIGVPVDLVTERAGEVVEPDELHLVGARPAREAEADGAEQRQADDEREEGHGGADEHVRRPDGCSASLLFLVDGGDVRRSTGNPRVSSSAAARRASAPRPAPPAVS